MIKEKRKRRKTSEDNGKEIMPRIKNERILGGNTINNELVKESSSKSHTGKESMHTTTHQPKHKQFAPTLTVEKRQLSLMNDLRVNLSSRNMCLLEIIIIPKIYATELNLIL